MTPVSSATQQQQNDRQTRTHKMPSFIHFEKKILKPPSAPPPQQLPVQQTPPQQPQQSQPQQPKLQQPQLQQPQPPQQPQLQQSFFQQKTPPIQTQPSMSQRHLQPSQKQKSSGPVYSQMPAQQEQQLKYPPPQKYTQHHQQPRQTSIQQKQKHVHKQTQHLQQLQHVSQQQHNKNQNKQSQQPYQLPSFAQQTPFFPKQQPQDDNNNSFFDNSAAPNNTGATDQFDKIGNITSKLPEYFTQSFDTGHMGGANDKFILDDQKRVNYINQMLQCSFSNFPEPSDSKYPELYFPENPYPVPSYYPLSPLPILAMSELVSKFDVNVLFFMFYYVKNPYFRKSAITELINKSWMYHVKLMKWFKRLGELRAANEEYEIGDYVYFDHENTWSQKKKLDFTFERAYVYNPESSL